MALADYYERAALAASQVIAGFAPDLFRRALEDSNIGLAIGRDAAISDHHFVSCIHRDLEIADIDL